MKFSALLKAFTLPTIIVLASACGEYSAEKSASTIVGQEAENALPESVQPLDLTITPEMLGQVIVESDEIVVENQAQVQLQDKKENDIQLKGRLLLESRENALLPAIEGAVVEIEVKTKSP